MHAERPLRVPVGHDAERWRTFPAERTLVVAARTVVSTTRVLECLPAVLRDDSRVGVVFAYDPTSAFNDGVLDLLHDSGCRVMPWSQLGDVSPDLLLTAGENVDVPEGTCPVLVLPHGIGFQKYVPDSRADRVRLSGLVPDALLEAGRAWLATSHPDQGEQLLAAHPEAAGRTLLVGDPCFDELAANAALRPAHRPALGVGDDRRLVVVSSTWGRPRCSAGTPACRRGCSPHCRTTRTGWRRSSTPTCGRRTAPGSCGGTSPPRSTRACCSCPRRTPGGRCSSPRTSSSGTTAG